MAGEANNLASHQGPEPNILNRKQQNFSVQMHIFPLEMRPRKVKHSKQTTMREVCTEVALLCNPTEYLLLAQDIFTIYLCHSVVKVPLLTRSVLLDWSVLRGSVFQF